jgi:NAD(P)-dependent dehydrogenase (short-subunit alcohol dehydrogenase family)
LAEGRSVKTMDKYEAVGSFGLEGKVVAVVGGGGANNGIGRATAVLFAKLGAKVAVLDINKEAADETSKLVNASGQEAASAWQVDALNENQLGKTVKEILDRYRRIDVWAHIVGGHKGRTLIEAIPLDLWNSNMERNLTSAFISARVILPVMKRQRSGKIVLISSFAARTIAVSGADYSVAKAGIITFTKQLAYEAGFFNINVNAVVPGPTHEPDPEKDQRDGRLPRVPLGRFACPEDQAKAIVFLASDWAKMITGVALDVDGGMQHGFVDWETYLAKHQAPAKA